MLHVNSCNVKHNWAKSVFRYFASAVNSNQSTKCNRKFLVMLSVVIETFKMSVMFLRTSFANCCLVYSDWALY